MQERGHFPARFGLELIQQPDAVVLVQGMQAQGKLTRSFHVHASCDFSLRDHCIRSCSILSRSAWLSRCDLPPFEERVFQMKASSATASKASKAQPTGVSWLGPRSSLNL